MSKDKKQSAMSPVLNMCVTAKRNGRKVLVVGSGGEIRSLRKDLNRFQIGLAIKKDGQDRPPAWHEDVTGICTEDHTQRSSQRNSKTLDFVALHSFRRHYPVVIEMLDINTGKPASESLPKAI